ncbi:MAG: pyridoxal phosphate-dependent aminotransferase family protein [Cytophagales bacterium]|nr:pyridoxal phosphate-dependent aminotransferase family protein [Cytophagales bacterium]
MGRTLDSAYFSWTDRLKRRKEEGLYRRLRSFRSGVLDFCSNDYLGLARDVSFEQEIRDKHAALLPLSLGKRNGGTGSRLISGDDDYLHEVESKLACFFGKESALLFPSGYVANLSLFSSLPGLHDLVLYDAQIHTSVKDGARMGHARRRSFKHLDIGDLEKKLETLNPSHSFGCYVGIEAIYSMTGEFCPFPSKWLSVCERYGACLIVDEAHSSGWVEGGRGLFHDQNVPIVLHTFGKAWGVQGACILGSKELKEYLINFARPLIYSTALTPYQVLCIELALSRGVQNGSLIRALEKNIRFFQTEAARYPHLKWIAQNSPIQMLSIDSVSLCHQIAAALYEKGFAVQAIFSPTVPVGQEGLRISLHAFNKKEDIARLLFEIEKMITRAWQRNMSE